MMDQLELPFPEKYDIFTDRLRPVSSKDFAIYQEGYMAYLKIREAAWHTRGYIPLIAEMDKIHEEFKKRVNTQCHS